MKIWEIQKADGKVLAEKYPAVWSTYDYKNATRLYVTVDGFGRAVSFRHTVFGGSQQTTGW